MLCKNQSVERDGVAFVKRDNPRNQKTAKKILTLVIYDEEARTNKSKDERAQGRIVLVMNTVR